MSTVAPVKEEKKSNALTKALSFLEQAKQQTEAVKKDLAKQLNEVCETIDVLTNQLGVKDVLKDPQYAEYVHRLNIQLEAPKPVAADINGKISGGRMKSEQVEQSILDSLAGGKEWSHAELKTAQPVVQLFKSHGKEVPNLFIFLTKLLEAKKITKTGERKEARYKLAPTK